MRLNPTVCFLFLSLLSQASMAGSINPRYLSELDGSFNPSLPGRVVRFFDETGTQKTDFGINAFSDPNDGSITSVAMVDINNPDTNLVGIGLARHLYSGAVDSGFQTTGKRVKDAYMTSVVDACRDPSGRIVVAGTTPGANGSAGNKDLALVRFNADGSDDATFAGDGELAFSMWDALNGTENDEAINDIDCLANGNLLLAGWIEVNSARKGFIAEIASTGSSTPVRTYTLDPFAGIDLQFTAAAEIDLGIAATSLMSGSANQATAHFMIPNGTSYFVTPGRNSVVIGESINWCGNPVEPRLIGIATVASGDFAFSGLREDVGGNIVPFLMRVQHGEILKVSCTDIDFGTNNAWVTPPVAMAGHVFVALGWQPFGTGPLTSRLRAYRFDDDGSAPIPVNRFGVDGMAQWSFPYNGADSNNRSFVQRLFFDPGLRLMTVGTRVWNGTDTDLALARFGSAGVFNDGFESL